MNQRADKIRMVFFDAVGTLIHPNPAATEVYAAMGRKFGSKVSPNDVRAHFTAAFRAEEQFDDRLGLRTDEAREQQRWRRIVAAVLDDVRDAEGCFQALFEHFSRPEAWRCDPAAAEVLDELGRRGYRVGLASNFDQRLRRVASGLAGLEKVTDLVISSEVGWRKPAPEFFAAAAQAVGLVAAELMLVGDDCRNDFEGARAVGWWAVLLDRQRGRVKAPGQIDQLSDLLGLLPGRCQGFP